MDDLIARLPKAEVHLHLEGTISAESLWATARANHVALSVGSLSELQGLYRFTSFDRFIDLWLLMCSCLRTGNDYERMVDGLLTECSRQNIRYAEVHFGGPEAGLPRNRCTPWFDRARTAGYPVVAHAGETGGAEHVRQAVLELAVRRVQHGTRAVEDPEVVRLLAERRICCDMALTSNECLRVVSSVAAHPLRLFVAAGVPVTLSTDDPPFFSTDLLREWQRARDELGLSMRELWELNVNGLRFGLADTGIRRRLFLEFQQTAARLDPSLVS